MIVRAVTHPRKTKKLNRGIHIYSRMKPKKNIKRHKRKDMVPYSQAITLVVLLYITFAICGYILYTIAYPPHYKTNKTYLETEADCVIRAEGTYCCEKRWMKYTNISKPDFGWVEVSNCVKYKRLS